MACRRLGVLPRTPSPRGGHSDGADVLRLALRVERGRSRRRRRGSNELRHGAVRVSFGSLVVQRDRHDTSWGAKKLILFNSRYRRSRHGAPGQRAALAAASARDSRPAPTRETGSDSRPERRMRAIFYDHRAQTRAPWSGVLSPRWDSASGSRLDWSTGVVSSRPWGGELSLLRIRLSCQVIS